MAGSVSCDICEGCLVLISSFSSFSCTPLTLTSFALGLTEQCKIHGSLLFLSSSYLFPMKSVPSLLSPKAKHLKQHAFDLSFIHCQRTTQQIDTWCLGVVNPFLRPGEMNCLVILYTHMACSQVLLNKVIQDVELNEQMWPCCSVVMTCQDDKRAH